MSETIPDSREYVHRTCGKVTEVSGGDFRNMAAPVPGMKGTMCAACGGFFPVSEFTWADSNEEIVAYYERHRARVPALTCLLCSRPLGLAIIALGFLAGIGIGVWAGYALGIIWGLLIGVVASLAGALATLLIWDGIEQRLLHSALGVPDVRCLK